MSATPTERPAPPDPGFQPTVAELLRRATGSYGDAEFLVTADLTLTYAQVDALSASAAAQLVAHGVGKASRVGIVVGNRPE
jgi:non-ribosomal peptide synthetase component E (peptide arylation enzyme)